MKVTGVTPPPWASYNDPDIQSEPAVNHRDRRAINSSSPRRQFLVETVQPKKNQIPDEIYDLVSINPDPGKTVGHTDKSPVPLDLGRNIDIDAYVENLANDFKSTQQDAATVVKQLFKDKWNLNIDPDNTYLTTFDYNNHDLRPPYPGKIVSQITLTEALIKNAQDVPRGHGVLVPHYQGGPSIRLVAHLPKVVPDAFEEWDRISPGRESAHITHTYQGIYAGPRPGQPQVYNSSTQLTVTPQAFKDEIWKTDFQHPYTEFLNSFWDSHDRKYPIVAKAALIKAADAQHQEGSLSAEGKRLVMRATGLASSTQAWADTLLTDLMKPMPADPGLEVGLLRIDRYPSTDLMYIHDKTTQTDAEGKSIQRTLLCIPGNSSPIHTFDSPAEMKTWLAHQAADPVKRKALEGHFRADQLSGNAWHAGVSKVLRGLGKWPNHDGRAWWRPMHTITTQPYNPRVRAASLADGIDTNCDVFHQIGERQRLRSYADANAEIVTDLDVTKANILSGLSKAAMIAMLFAPLAVAIPEVALAMDALYIASGLVQAGIGADNIVKNKPGGVDNLVFGVLNATLPVVVRGTVAVSAAKSAAEGGPVIEGAPIASEPRVEHELPPAEQPSATPGIHDNFASAENAERAVPVVEQVSQDGELVTLSGTKDNLNKVEDNLYTFSDMNKKGTQHRLNIIAHGDGTHIYYKGRLHTPEGLMGTLKRAGIFPQHYDNIRILSCYSGQLGEDSFAAIFQRMAGRPVKGYIGEVTTRYSAEQILGEPMQVYTSGENPVAVDEPYESDGVSNKEFKPEKTNPYSIFRNPFRWWRFSYKPVNFPEAGGGTTIQAGLSKT